MGSNVTLRFTIPTFYDWIATDLLTPSPSTFYEWRAADRLGQNNLLTVLLANP